MPIGDTTRPRDAQPTSVEGLDRPAASPPAAIEAGQPHAGPDHVARAPRHVWIFAAFAAIAGFFLLTEHRAHALGVLPLVLLAACPLMHLVMHRGHGSQRTRSK